MNKYITNCPCCNRQLKICVNEDSGENIATVFFDEENQEELQKLLDEKGIELALKGGE